jgi:hypothetical protein
MGSVSQSVSQSKHSDVLLSMMSLARIICTSMYSDYVNYVRHNLILSYHRHVVIMDDRKLSMTTKVEWPLMTRFLSQI